ncbi:hypothetical protein K7640_05645 [Micromonospora sp. PLK6-60]|uniref:hypothetical protein n=1 Tax=Micromonospora sp. PLK6-60 TaxID=2873383 RepID=UPI001CA7628E|nr:hypothetical protein [Micromonospora sp. PLK6-60]MBY8871325.1 hypothetical protein [Micromonospora sp. PLK6-60]
MRRRHHHTETVVRLMADARDEQVPALAEAALAEAWVSDPKAPRRIWIALMHRPKPALRFLFAPAPDCPHEPRVRLVTAQPDWVVGHALHHPDPELRAALAGVVRTTDNPALLKDLDGALSDPFAPLPAVLDLALDNPHLCRPAPIGARYAGLAAVAILKERFDLLDSYDLEALVPTLVRVAGGPCPAPAVEECRRRLRALGPGPARERLCLHAIEGDAEALAAVADSGQEPASPHLLPLFLFRTEQWERYDALDPDGVLVDEQTRHYDEDVQSDLAAIARRNGRREPKQWGFSDPGF